MRLLGMNKNQQKNELGIEKVERKILAQISKSLKEKIVIIHFIFYCKSCISYVTSFEVTKKCFEVT